MCFNTVQKAQHPETFTKGGRMKIDTAAAENCPVDHMAAWAIVNDAFVLYLPWPKDKETKAGIQRSLGFQPTRDAFTCPHTLIRYLYDQNEAALALWFTNLYFPDRAFDGINPPNLSIQKSDINAIRREAMEFQDALNENADARAFYKELKELLANNKGRAPPKKKKAGGGKKRKLEDELNETIEHQPDENTQLMED